MRTILTSEDVKNIVVDLFKENNEEIIIRNADTGEQTTNDLVSYLNIEFYNWKQRVVEVSNTQLEDFDDFAKSMFNSMNKAYALIELVDEEVVVSQDIDSATKMGKITFFIQADKVKNLEYYIQKLRMAYLGNPQEMVNAEGNRMKLYYLFGTLLYDTEPIMTQVGEVIECSCNFNIGFLNYADTYGDYTISLSLDNTNFYVIPITKATAQAIFTATSVPTQTRPDLTGVLSTTISSVKTFSFFDYDITFTKLLNHLFWSLSAIKIDNVDTIATDVNKYIYVKVETGDHTYLYKDVITQLDKTITNNDFTITTMTLKTAGKIQ